ncbi:DUF6270 domain-containing protein [Pengzhenrongella sicca]|nr:DUF6270 domain-containing protein [Pengzhenrongella sicca]
MFVYGSCVARDVFGYLDEQEFALGRYVARQSLVSVYAPIGGALTSADDAPAEVDMAAAPIPSFGARMVAEDRCSSLLPVLAEEAPRLHALVWDITDERLGVYRTADGYVTRSVELIASGADGILAAEYPLVPFASPEHLRLWIAALGRFVTDLATLGLLDRTLMLAVPWAEHTSDGNATPASMGTPPAAGNAAFAPYYAAAREHGVSVYELPAAAVRSDPGHRWGEAPFHYDERVYRTIAAELRSRFGVREPLLPDPQFARRYGWDKIVDPWLDSMPVRADRIPSAYRIWQSARRYLQAGNTERALQCEQLIKLLHNSYLSAECELGSRVEFGYGGIGLVVHKLAEVGDDVTLGSGVTLGGAFTPTRYSERHGRSLNVPRIEEAAVISTGAKILGGVTIGAFAIVGANSVVTKDVPPGAVVAGAPARVLRTLDAETVLRSRSAYLPLRPLSNDDLVARFSARVPAPA